MDIIVIGAGMGALFCGALLAKEGHKVTLLEKNALIGGGLQAFNRKGELYETGMHVAGGFERGGTLDLICRYLGIRDSLKLMPADMMASITYLEEARTYNIPFGRETFKNYLISLYPEEQMGIEAYIEALFRISEEEDLFYMKGGEYSHAVHSEEFNMPADAFIASYIRNVELRALLAYLNPLYAGVAGHTPAYLHAMISVTFIEQPCRFLKGGSELAQALAQVIIDGGGEILTNRKVERISVQDRRVVCVADTAGREYKADTYISDVHPCQLLNMIDGKAFTPGYSERLRNIPCSASAFKLYLKLKPNTVPYQNHQITVLDSMRNAWNLCDYDPEGWPHGCSCFMTPQPDGKWASHISVMSLMSWDEVSCWESTSMGKRTPEYEQWKNNRKARLMDMLCKLYPDISSHIEDEFAASPLTFRDWLGSKNGSAYGYSKDSQNLIFSQLPVHTKVGNLFLTGQNVNMHGIGGVPMTAIETAEAIVGQDVIVSKIKQMK